MVSSQDSNPRLVDRESDALPIAHRIAILSFISQLIYVIKYEINRTTFNTDAIVCKNDVVHKVSHNIGLRSGEGNKRKLRNCSITFIIPPECSHSAAIDKARYYLLDNR